ncbi:MAG: GNAT family N-acetyltransferase [Sedimentisphaerales bacterium]|nr:GNAT family N-acetyltransferase [Sedimentisphaerales bacterium]
MIEIRQMRTGDLRLGLRLSRQAGWNQTESDWLRFMSMEPEGCFVAEFNGCPVGTTATCIFDKIAWIAMVLVDKESRGQGVGTKLLKHSLNYLDGLKIKTVRLDATDLGRPIYEKLGFVPEYELARFEGIAQPCKKEPPGGSLKRSLGMVIPAPSPKPAALRMPPFADMIEFDRQITGTNRAKMLGRLFNEFPRNIRILTDGDKIEGFITMRPGANAVQVGPCTATINAGSALLSDALNRCAGKAVFIDMPTGNVHAVKIGESSGLKIQRRFMRMCRGERIKDNIEAIWAGSGPEKG